MSDKHDFFDRQTREQFDKYSPEVPGDAWDKLMAERKKRKPRFFWWNISKNNRWLISSAILLSAGGIFLTSYYFLNKKNSNGETISYDKKSSTANQQTIQNGHNENETGAKKSGEENKTIATIINEKRANDILTAHSISGSAHKKDSKSLLNENSIGTSTKKPSEKVKISSDWISTEKKDNDYTVKNFAKNSHIKKAKSGAGNNENIHNEVGKTEEADVGTNLKKQVNDSYSTHGQMFAGRNTVKLKAKRAFPKKTVMNITEAITEQELEGLAIQGGLLERLQFNAEKITAVSMIPSGEKSIIIGKIAIPDCPVAEKDAASNKTYFELYASPDRAFKKYSDTANSLFLQKRKQSIQFVSAFSAGVRFTKVFHNGISFRTGINFSQVNEKFSFVQGNWVQLTYQIDPVSGDTTGTTSITGTRYKTTINRYRTIDVPLLLGYEIGNGRFHFNINAGPVINIYSWQKGDVLDTTFKPVNITTNKGASAYQYKTNTGIGFMGAVSVYYKLHPRLHLWAEPYLRYNFTPMSRDVFSLQEKFTTIGVRLGVRLDF